MTRIRIELDTAQLDALLAQVPGNAIDEVGRALHDEALVAFNRSQAIVPFRWGILQGSGQVRAPKLSASGVDVELSYGGAASAYAMIMHEGNFNFRGGRQNKYLEKPVQAAIPRIGPAVRAALERAIARSQ